MPIGIPRKSAGAVEEKKPDSTGKLQEAAKSSSGFRKQGASGVGASPPSTGKVYPVPSGERKPPGVERFFGKGRPYLTEREVLRTFRDVPPGLTKTTRQERVELAQELKKEGWLDKEGLERFKKKLQKKVVYGRGPEKYRARDRLEALEKVRKYWDEKAA